ncbi:MFS transporter [Pandoraea sp.]|uniref:MFS transporter n=1 Tax=Pandoraea sp. TaxID=1883445 RepID=UPI0011FCC29D|nr:MFS transporter [Pandoraea sp.]TAL52843.1 MAG: MFS transporter [Pandoraea sp.]TAM19712.1 MAG: MFS transporter [Pandoraea sp.]
MNTANSEVTELAPASVSPDSRLRRVALASMAGTTIEAFDFLAYGTAAALVFNKLFFPTLDPTAGTLAAFGAFASGLFARPIGGIIFGHFGDRLGRKAILILSLILMGVCTVLNGLLPTYESLGIWAAVLLVLLRIGQGISFGGELGGAMLMAVEHAPAHRKSLFGSLPQAGAPLGILLSSGAFALMNLLPNASFMRWGWRIPFVASAILIAVGVFIRMKVEETPDFTAVRQQRKIAAIPAWDVIARHKRPLLLTIGGKLGEVTLIYTIIVFSISYAMANLGFSRSAALNAVVIGSLGQSITIPLFGWLGDKIGARRLYIAGTLLLAVMAVPLFRAMGSGSHGVYTAAVVIALMLNYAIIFGPQSSLYSAQFPAELRYSGMSIGIQIAATLGGGLAPIIATTLVAHGGGIGSVGIYLTVLGLIGALSAFLMKPSASD